MAVQKYSRKELKKDSFVMHTERILSFIQENATAIGVTLVVLVALLVGGTYVRQGQAAAKQEASYLLYLGQTLVSQGDYLLAMAPLEECIQKHGRSDYAKHARVGLVQAMLGSGEVMAALARLESYHADVGHRHPAGKQLALLHAYALADMGQYREAANALEAQLTDEMPHQVIYEHTIQRARWLEAAGQHLEAVELLTRLNDDIRKGDLQFQDMGNDFEQRLEVSRALAR